MTIKNGKDKYREVEKMEDIKEIANKIKTKGGKLYLVGGAVRDTIL